jgi:LacI family transcriptional regulator
VVVDGVAGTYAATQHLLAQGFTNIALVITQLEQTQMAARQQGYRQALLEHKQPELVQEIAFPQEPEQIVFAMQRFFETHPYCDAVLFATNYLGVSGLEALNRLGRRIPEQIAVVSFDDNDLFRLYSPPITVVAQPMETLAESVINALLNDLEAPTTTDTSVQLQLAPQLVVRASSIRSIS